MNSKYKGIDQREIKCCCGDPNCNESGISFSEGNMLNFHFLESRLTGLIFGKIELTQTTKAMILNKETARQLIKHLKTIK